MLTFTKPHSLEVPRIALKVVYFPWERPVSVSTCPSLGLLPSGHLEGGTLGPIF